MKKNIMLTMVVVLSFLLMGGCSPSPNKPNKLKEQISILKTEREAVEKLVKDSKTQLDNIQIDIVVNQELLEQLKHEVDGDKAVYILELQLKQSHFSLDISKHAKDAMNAITMEIPVDKDFYNSQEKGSELLKEFRMGSAILNGSYGSWKVTVVNKRVEYIPK